MKSEEAVRNKERIMAIFKGERPDKTPWMPRIEHWYNVNGVLGTLPAEYQGLDLADVYRDLDASIRLYTLFSDSIYGFAGGASSGTAGVAEPIGRLPAPPYPAPLRVRFGGDVKVTMQRTGDFILITYKMPVGTLTSRMKICEHGMSWYFVEYPLKDVKDFKIMAFILENTKVEFDSRAFQDWERWLKGQGMQWYQFNHLSPLQRLIIQYMGFERSIVSLYRHPSEVERFMDVIKETDDQFYEVIGNSSFEVVNLGGNLDCRMVSPSLFEKYYIPYLQERSEQLHRKGKYTIYHVDGYAKTLLPFFKETGLDGVEALTAKPTGDMTLEEIKEALGDEIVYVDGIPFYYFLPQISLKEFEALTRKILRMFPNNLILGISDEMPPPGEVRKLRLVPKIIDEEQGRR